MDTKNKIRLEVYNNIVMKIPQVGPERQSSLDISADTLSQEEHHEGEADEEDAAQGGANGQAEEAAGADEASRSKLQNTAIDDKFNLRPDYLAQDVIFSRLDVIEQQLKEPMDLLQLQVENGTLHKHKEVKENIMPKEYRYNCIESNAVVGQVAETVRDDEDGGQQRRVHVVVKQPAGGQHAQGVAEAGGGDDEPVGAHVQEGAQLD